MSLVAGMAQPPSSDQRLHHMDHVRRVWDAEIERSETQDFLVLELEEIKKGVVSRVDDRELEGGGPSKLLCRGLTEAGQRMECPNFYSYVMYEREPGVAAKFWLCSDCLRNRAPLPKVPKTLLFRRVEDDYYIIQPGQLPTYDYFTRGDRRIQLPVLLKPVSGVPSLGDYVYIHSGHDTPAIHRITCVEMDKSVGLVVHNMLGERLLLADVVCLRQLRPGEQPLVAGEVYTADSLGL